MKEFFDEDEYLEDIYGDEIKNGDRFYKYQWGKIKDSYYLVHEKNIAEFVQDEFGMKKEER